MQHLMDHTVTRLLQYLEEVRETLSDVERCNASGDVTALNKENINKSSKTMLTQMQTFFKVHLYLFNWLFGQTKKSFGKIQHLPRLDSADQ